MNRRQRLADLRQAGRVDQPSPVPSTLAGEAARTLISSTDTIHLKLAPGGGACVLLTPAP